MTSKLWKHADDYLLVRKKPLCYFFLVYRWKYNKFYNVLIIKDLKQIIATVRKR